MNRNSTTDMSKTCPLYPAEIPCAEILPDTGTVASPCSGKKFLRIMLICVTLWNKKNVCRGMFPG